MRQELWATDAAVVTLRPGARPPAALRSEGSPLGAAERHWRVPATGPEDALDLALRWAADPAVASAIPDLWLSPAPAAFDDPVYPGQWYLADLEMEPLFDRSLGDPGVRIAVIDGAIDIVHPDLAGAVVSPWDAVDGDGDPSPVPGQECQDGSLDLCDTHGTSVAGIAAARANNGVGIVGLCPECALIPIRMLGEGSPLSAEIVAFEHAIEQDAAVINNSWGYAEAIPAPAPLVEVIARASTETRGGLGAVVVFAAGNDDRQIEDGEIGALPGVVNVSAIDSYGLPTAYTNFGASVDLAAPSATVTLAPDGGITETFGGTSAAAPVVAGIAGWILSIAPELTAEEVQQLLIDTARQTSLVTFDARGHHAVYGHGVLDPREILARLEGEAPPSGEPEPPEGCGCAAPGGGSRWPVALGALALLARRRR